ncbi:trypsin-like serine peptidase [Teichococcus coralli]|nr:trypsin-like peptidase domain-containing protein [Pseudoroseomonas coralli]
MPDEQDARAIAAKLRAVAPAATAGAAGRDQDAEAAALGQSLVSRARDAMLRLLNGTADGNIGGGDATALEAVMFARGRPALRIVEARIEPISDQLHPGSGIWRTVIANHEGSMLTTCASTGAVRVRDKISGRGPWVQGTAWVIGGDCVVTNRHVVFPGGGFNHLAQRLPGQPPKAILKKHLDISVDFAFDDTGPSLSFPVAEVLYVAEEGHPLDVAVLRLAANGQAAMPGPLVMMEDVLAVGDIYVVGHPGKLDPSLVPEKVQAVFGSPDERKRVSLGKQMEMDGRYPGDAVYDASSIGGFSGGAVCAIGLPGVGALHYMGDESNGNRGVLTSELLKSPVQGFIRRGR